MCDTENHRVQVFGLNGSFARQLGTKGSGDGQLGRLHGVVVNGGEVLLTDFRNHRVQVFGLDGSFVRQWGGEGDGVGQFDFPWGVAVSEGRCSEP